ncbi:Small heat shock protein OV25-1 [Toxocara canis]|uniref:Small heat shock protein OV25-1 n=3 Tax=Ascaridoidea TaxID=33256 RepID=A0A0B2VAZ7_TOXCA|nr:Small heat shock protein OV25-1 [Toxocara canis]VDM44299.1 unnamed protein product [Toxocara canis]
MYPLARRDYEREWDTVAPWHRAPVEHLMHTMFNELARPVRGITPYWMDQPMMRQVDTGNVVGNVTNDKEKFAVEMDVSQFAPEELKVEVRDNHLVVEGHHEERSDQHGTIERHFVRRYALPKNADVQTVSSHLSDVGILTIIAPKTTSTLPPTRKIPIQTTPRAGARKHKDHLVHGLLH